MHFPAVGVTDHLIDGSWYGENTDQSGISAGNTPEERAELGYETQVLVSKIK
jgi:hypothetical protein